MPALKFNRPIYLVVVNYPGEDSLYITETALDDTDIVTVCKDLRDKQFDRPCAVIEIDLINRTCREATHDFKDLIPD